MKALWLVAALLGPAAQPALAQKIADKARVCFSCHGDSGTSAQALTPSLGGQPSFFVVAQLFLMRDGRRTKQGTPMDAFAKGLSDDDLRAYGELIANQPGPAAPAQGLDNDRYAKGRALAEQHHCGGCHAAGYSGHDQVPRVVHQREDYLLKALRDYRSGERIGYGSASMPEAVARLTDPDLAALAHYLAHLR